MERPVRYTVTGEPLSPQRRSPRLKRKRDALEADVAAAAADEEEEEEAEEAEKASSPARKKARLSRSPRPRSQSLPSAAPSSPPKAQRKLF